MLDSLQVTTDLTRLKINWLEGAPSELTAQTLRQEARDAASVRARIDSGPFAVAADIQITALEQVGVHGVNIHFSDGHDRGIYPFVYLRELSDRFDN
jgi:DUF971 family protein